MSAFLPEMRPFCASGVGLGAFFLPMRPFWRFLVVRWGTAGSQDRARLLQLARQPEFCGSGFLAAVALTIFGHVFCENALVCGFRGLFERIFARNASVC